MKHTAGKWSFTGTNAWQTVYKEETHEHIAAVLSNNKKEDARLIAAAPELLEACKKAADFAQEVMNLLVGYQPQHFNENINGARGAAWAIMDVARAAIEAAEKEG